MTIWQSRNIPRSNRRSGGREARRSVRSAPLAEELRPVRAGMTGGTFRPLDAAAVDAIEDAVYQILEEIGLSKAPESGVAYLTNVGAITGDDGRTRFPRPVVSKMLAQAARNITLHAQNPKHDLLLSGSRVHFGTAGAAVHVVDVQNNAYRESHLADIYDAARIVENMDNIHFFQRPMVARDIEDPAALDLNTLYAALKGTTKHVGVSFTEAPFMTPCISMLHDIAGDEDKWRERPFVSNSNCFVVPPLRFATESCLVMEEAVKAGMPVLLLSAGQAGATAPASIAGAVAQALSEVVAGLIYVNEWCRDTRALLAPGHLYPICERVPCPVVRVSRDCSPLPVLRCCVISIYRAARPREWPTQRCQMPSQVMRREARLFWPDWPASTWFMRLLACMLRFLVSVWKA